VLYEVDWMESAKIGYDKDWNDGFIYCI